MTPALLAEIAQRYQRQAAEAPTPLTGGEESAVWRLATDCEPIVVRISPAWRTVAELQWVHDLTRFTARVIPEVVAPLSAVDGSTIFLHAGQPVAVFPFVEGKMLDREDSGLQQAAALLLVRLHQAMSAWPGHRVRPPSGPAAPVPWSAERDPQALLDADLDLWYATQHASAQLPTGPVHGDYYRRNLLCLDKRICGVIDWDESHIAPYLEEVAWAMWEFAKVPSGDDLYVERALAFFQTYCEAGGLCQKADVRSILPLIRQHFREEIRRSLAAAERGEKWDETYVEKEIRAFQHLRGQVL